MLCVAYEFRCLVDQTVTYVGMSERNMALTLFYTGGQNVLPNINAGI